MSSYCVLPISEYGASTFTRQRQSTLVADLNLQHVQHTRDGGRWHWNDFQDLRHAHKKTDRRTMMSKWSRHARAALADDASKENTSLQDPGISRGGGGRCRLVIRSSNLPFAVARLLRFDKFQAAQVCAEKECEQPECRERTLLALSPSSVWDLCAHLRLTPCRFHDTRASLLLFFPFVDRLC